MTLGSGLSFDEKGFGGGEVEGGVGDVDDLKRAACNQRVEGKLAVQTLIPGADGAADDSAHGKGGVKCSGIVLHEAGGDHAAEGMSPGDGSGGSANVVDEDLKGGKLVGDGVLDGPSGGGVGGTGESIAVGEQVGAGKGIADIERGIGAAGRDVAVAVKKERAIPSCRGIDNVGGAVGEGAGDVLLGGCESGEQGDYDGGEGERQCSLGDVWHRLFLPVS